MTRSSGQVPEAYTLCRAMATTTTTAMMMTNVDDKASGMSARHFHIASRSGNDDNNYWQQRTMSAGRRCLVREHTTYFHRVTRWRRQQCQAHNLRVKHRINNKPGKIKLGRAQATSTSSNIDDLVRECTRLSSAIALVRKCTWLSAIVRKRTSYIPHCVLSFDNDNTQLCGQ